MLEWLDELAERPGREWPGMPVPSSTSAALDVLGDWLTAALEYRPRTRALAIENLRRSSRADRG